MAAYASCNVTALCEARLACLPAPGVHGIDLLVLVFEDPTTFYSTQVMSSNAPAATKWVRELRVSDAFLVDAQSSHTEAQAVEDVGLEADSEIAVFMIAPQTQAVAFKTRALCALNEGDHLLLLAQFYSEETVCFDAVLLAVRGSSL